MFDQFKKKVMHHKNIQAEEFKTKQRENGCNSLGC